MRIFGLEIPNNEVPDGTFKQLMLDKGGDFLWYLNAPPMTKAEKDWIIKILDSRERQLLAGVPFEQLRYEQIS